LLFNGARYLVGVEIVVDLIEGSFFVPEETASAVGAECFLIERLACLAFVVDVLRDEF